MGQKVNPNGFRIGVNKDWNSTWVAGKKDIAVFLKEDSLIRKHIMDNYCSKTNNCSVSKITIERTPSRISVNIYTGRPGMLIGQKGAGTEKLKKELKAFIGTKDLNLDIREVKNVDCDATLVAQSIATQLEKRVAWRRAMKMAIQKAMKSNIKGIKVMIGGRLDGADIARSEHYQQGILPLHTLRSDIEYGFAEAKTTFGIIGVKCWICYGEIKGKARHNADIVRPSRPERSDDRKFQDRKPRPYSGGFGGDRPRDGAPRQFDRPRPEGAPRQFDRPRTDGAPRTFAPRPTGAPSFDRPRPATGAPTTQRSSAPITPTRVFAPKQPAQPTPNKGGDK